jgi:hypothetical protein
LERRRKHSAMVRDFDHGVGGGRVDVDCGSWSLPSRPFEPGAIL